MPDCLLLKWAREAAEALHEGLRIGEERLQERGNLVRYIGSLLGIRVEDRRGGINRSGFIRPVYTADWSNRLHGRRMNLSWLGSSGRRCSGSFVLKTHSVGSAERRGCSAW